VTENTFNRVIVPVHAYQGRVVAFPFGAPVPDCPVRFAIRSGSLSESPTIRKSSVPLFDREHCIGKCTRFLLRKIVPGTWDDSVFMAAREL
jgi:hypothetical protein